MKTQTMLNELENKIRKAIPELMELSDGCVLEIKTNKQRFVFLNRIIDEVANCSFNNEYNYNIRISDCNIIGKPVQLNHVLMYLNSKGETTESYNFRKILKLWNLKSNLLSDQSEEIISFLNNL